jgi:hypothetical protein
MFVNGIFGPNHFCNRRSQNFLFHPNVEQTDKDDAEIAEKSQGGRRLLECYAVWLF